MDIIVAFVEKQGVDGPLHVVSFLLSTGYLGFMVYRRLYLFFSCFPSLIFLVFFLLFKRCIKMVGKLGVLRWPRMRCLVIFAAES